MSLSVELLKEKLGAGARPSKYRVYISYPSSLESKIPEDESDIYCKASAFPGLELGQIEVWSQGRKAFIPGDTSYSGSWTATFYNNEHHEVRSSIMAWMERLDNYKSNTHSGNPKALMGTLKIAQLDSKGEETAIYTLYGAFPTSVAEISTGDDQADSIEEFDVTFSYTNFDHTTKAPSRNDMADAS